MYRDGVGGLVPPAMGDPVGPLDDRPRLVRWEDTQILLADIQVEKLSERTSSKNSLRDNLQSGSIQETTVKR